MRSFLKIFLASLLALVVFVVISVFFLFGFLGGLASKPVPDIGSNAVLMLDFSDKFSEKMTTDPLAGFSESRYDIPGVYDVVRMIRFARTDTAIKGIYIKANGNANGLGTTEEIRNALREFKRSGKFIYAFGDVIPMRAYYAASVADQIYCNPKGGVEWKGLTSEMGFIKGSLDKLEIEPEIFYAGKFKSATEPLRADKMSDANRLQLTVILGEIFNHMLAQTALSRVEDSAILRRCVDEQLIQTAADALHYRLVDGLKYNDQVMEEIKEKIKASSITSINFVPMGKYYEAVKNKFSASGNDRIALIYAEGDIVGGLSKRDIF